MNDAIHVLSVLHPGEQHIVDLFSENLRRYLNGEPLLNLVQRELGY